MSNDIIKSLVIQDHKVYFTACTDISCPSNFYRYEASDYTRILRKQGLESMLREVARHALEGKFTLENGSSWCRLLNQGHSLLRHTHHLDRVLPTDVASAFIALCAVKWHSDPSYQPTDILQKLIDKYHIKSNVFVVSESNASLQNQIACAKSRSCAQTQNPAISPAVKQYAER